MLFSNLVVAYEFTVSSFNAGGLTDHYDYVRAVSMHLLVQERHQEEPEQMAELERIQNLALKILFSDEAKEKMEAQKEWNEKGYEKLFSDLTKHPDADQSSNARWKEKASSIVSPYNVRPIVLYDEETKKILEDHIKALIQGQNLSIDEEAGLSEQLDIVRKVMAERIFRHELKYDIIALQEADYLEASMFPENYEVLFSNASYLIDGIAWNGDRFELLESVEGVEKGLAVVLKDLESGKRVAVASGHLKGSNPFQVERDSSTGELDSAKGDQELVQIIDVLDAVEADLKVIAMDSNVTAMHPRLSLLKGADYTLDYRNYLDPTCTSPWQVLNTRIDWIAIKSEEHAASIQNVPVLGVGLNNPWTNISDHKPIPSKVSY